MQQQEILHSLAELEKSLANVNTAASMVRQNTEAYAAVQRQLQTYADSLANVSSLITGMIQEIKVGHAACTTTFENANEANKQQIEKATQALATAEASIRNTAAYAAVQQQLQTYADCLANVSSLITGMVQEVKAGLATYTTTFENTTQANKQQIEKATQALAAAEASIRNTTQTQCTSFQAMLHDVTTQLKNTLQSFDEASIRNTAASAAVQQQLQTYADSLANVSSLITGMIQEVKGGLATYTTTFENTTQANKQQRD